MRGGLLMSARRKILDESARGEARKIDVRARVGMRRERIAIGRELQRAESQHGNGGAFVAGAAVGLGGNGVAAVRRTAASAAPQRHRSAASVASVPSAFQTYVANRQAPSGSRSMKRVSTGRPSENSFHRRVPGGNSHASGRDASIAAPGGR